MADAPRNLILTGIPRSGTTLLSALVDSMDNAVALNEPKWQYFWAVRNQATATSEDFVKWLVGDFADLRHKLLQGIPFPERRSRKGEALTNYYRQDNDQREQKRMYHVVPFTRPGLEADFTLGIKHNGLYLSILPELIDIGAFTIVAILRDPVGVIASWNHIPIPLRIGQMPGAIVYWKEMAELTSATMNMLKKQVRMYDLVCQRLHTLRHRIHIIRYEDLTENPGLLADITGIAPSMPVEKIRKRDNEFYGIETDPIRDMLKREGRHWQHFYEL